MNAGDTTQTAPRRAAIMAAVSSYLAEESVQSSVEFQQPKAPDLISAISPAQYEGTSLNGWKMALWRPIRSVSRARSTVRSGWQQL